MSLQYLYLILHLGGKVAHSVCRQVRRFLGMVHLLGLQMGLKSVKFSDTSGT